MSEYRTSAVTYHHLRLRFGEVPFPFLGLELEPLGDIVDVAAVGLHLPQPPDLAQPALAYKPCMTEIYLHS